MTASHAEKRQWPQVNGGPQKELERKASHSTTLGRAQHPPTVFGGNQCRHMRAGDLE